MCCPNFQTPETFDICVKTLEENDLNDNTKEIELGYTNLVIEQEAPHMINGELCYTLLLSNISAIDAENVVFNLLADEKDGAIIYNQTFERIEGKTEKYIYIPEETLKGCSAAYTYVSTMTQQPDDKEAYTLLSITNETAVLITSNAFAAKAETGGSIMTADLEPEYDLGTKIALTAKAEEGYVFAGWKTNAGGTFDDQDEVSTTFTMPGNDVEVTAAFKKQQPAKTLSLSDTDKEMKIGDTYQLMGSVMPDESSSKIVWTSTDPDVVKVGKNGLLTARKAGTVLITASLINERLSAQCQVTVKELKINSIRMVYPVVQLNGVNDSEQLDIIVDSENASEEVVWISDNEHIAKVDQNGRVTAVGVGTTRIKAVSASTTDLKEELQIKAVCEIRVKNPLVSIGFDKNVVDIKKNQSAQIRVTYNPTDTTDDKSVSWVVYDDSVLSIATSGVNNEIAVITGKDAGTTLIEAIVNNVRTWCTVTVTLTPTGISLSSTSVEIEEGDGAYLEAYVTPQNVITKITWKSSNTSVASVSNEGEIYAQCVGTTVISALTDNGLSASCTVTVKKATRDIVNVTSLQNFQSAHPYKNNSDIMWVYNSPGASVIKLTFSADTQFEGSYDCLKVYDQNNSLLKKYRERELAGKTISIAGQMVKLRLITHNNVNKYGFKVNAVNAGYSSEE